MDGSFITEITSMSNLTLDGSFIPHSLVYQEEEQEPETITDVVEIASSQSTPLVPPPETPPLSEPKPKENLEPNPHHTLIPYPSRLQKDKFQSLENPTGRAGYFVYSINIVDSLSNRVPIQNDKTSGSPTLSPDPVVESLSPSFTPFEDIDLLLEETDAFLSLDDSIPPGIDNGIYDSEGDILFLEGLLNDEIPRDLSPLELNNDPEEDILFLENLLKDEPLEAKKSEINPLIREPPNTFLMGDEEIKLNSHEDIDDLVPIPRVSEKPLYSLDYISKTFETTITDHLFDVDSEFTLNPIFGIHNKESDESETETIMDEVQNHSPQSTAQIPPPYEKLNFDLTMPKPILTFSHFRYGIFGSHRVFDILGPRLPFSLSYNFGLVFSKEYLKFLSLNIFLLGDENEVFDLGIIVVYVESKV
ncbi:hypothetical protein Tco_0223871 [Tanacetum coccineum]